MLLRFFVFLALLLAPVVSAQTSTEQDLMVGYTVSARDSKGGTSQIIAEIRQGIINTNLSMGRSEARAMVVERMIAEFSIAEKGRGIGAMLGEWRRKRGGEAFGRSQAYWENELGIDFAMIISNVLSGNNGEAENTGSYSSIKAVRITNGTFPHELGHNYGCTHNGGYNFSIPIPGGTDTTNRFTLMKPGGTFFGTVTRNYSNPNISIDINNNSFPSDPSNPNTFPIGTPNNNNAARINERMGGRENVRQRNNNPSPSDPRRIDGTLSQDSFSFDFGTVNSSVEVGWTRVSPATTGNVYWSTEVSAIDRESSTEASAINQDFVTHNAPATLSVKAQNGLWNVSVNMTDPSTDRDNMQLDAEAGQVILSDIDRSAGAAMTISFSVVVTDGSLDLEISDVDPGDSWVLSRLSLSRLSDQNVNTDGDLLADAFEYAFFGDLTTSAGAPGDDQDNDGLNDLAEQNAGTNPNLSDTDKDGLSDGTEVNGLSSNPNAIDSDGDGYLDAAESLASADPAASASIPQIPDLVAYYPFDEGSGGTAADLAGSAQNAQEQSGTIVWSDTRQLIGSACLNLQGTAFMQAGSALPTGTNAFTISLWANPALDPNSLTYRGIFAGRGIGDQLNAEFWGINISGTNPDFRFGGQGVQPSGITMNEIGGWYHLVMTWETNGSTGTASIYVNGVLRNTSTNVPSSFTAPGQGFFVGIEPSDSNRVFNGQIDDLAILSRRLSDSEISTIYSQGNNGRSVIAALAVGTIDPNADDDNDGISDAWEFGFLNSLGTTNGGPTEDFDNDGLIDSEEFTRGTNPTLIDTDNDGLTDGNEVNLHSTNPTDTDSDNDGFLDGDEITQRSNPLAAASVPRINGLVAYYPFDEGRGSTAFDIAPHHSAQNAQQEVGTVGWTISAQLIGSGALDLDGSSALLAPDALVADGVGEAGVEAFTFSIWINPDSEGAFKGVFTGREGAGNWGINAEGREIDFRYVVPGGASTGFNTADNTILTSDGWYHVAMTWKSTGTGSEARMYLNGVNVITRTNVARSDYAVPTLGFFLGGDGTRGGRFFDGQIDDLAVFSRALSLAEVQQIHAAGNAGRGIFTAIAPPPLVAPLLRNFVRQIVDGNSEDITFSFDTQENAYYDIYRSENLVDWQRIQEGVLGTGASIQILDENGATGKPKLFYTIEQK